MWGEVELLARYIYIYNLVSICKVSLYVLTLYSCNQSRYNNCSREFMFW